MAIRTKQFQVVGAIIEPVSVFMIDMEDEKFSQPSALDGTPETLTTVRPSRFEQSTPQDVRFLTPPLSSQDENLLPGKLLRPLMIGAPIRSLPQKMRGIDLESLQFPGNMCVRSAGLRDP
jgi:hypothetical protein